MWYVTNVDTTHVLCGYSTIIKSEGLSMSSMPELPKPSNTGAMLEKLLL